MDQDHAFVDRYCDDAEVGHITSLSRTTRWRLRQRRKFPDPDEISPGRKATLLSKIQAWMESQAA